MKVHTDARTSADLLKIVNEAVTEAGTLRKRLERNEKTLLSTRLIMGHELKRPATAIKGYLELALEDASGLSGEAREAVEKARNECRLLDELSAFFLNLLRVDAAPTPSTPMEPVDVASCVEEVIESLPEPLCALERATVTVEPEGLEFGTDPDALKLILTNLIENALIYSDASSRVNISIERAEDKRGMIQAGLLKIRVEDRGRGIPEDFIQRIFRPFVRLRDDITDGSGLGLTLVRSLVELYGGSVYIKSEEKRGTTVHVTIPEAAKAGEPSVLS